MNGDTSRPRRRTLYVALGALLGLGLSAGLVVGFIVVLGAGLSDEWVCAEGEVPAGVAPVKPGTASGGCYADDKPLPDGYEADAWGRRPLGFNCDKDGYVGLEQVKRPNAGYECVREEIVEAGLPSKWRVSDDF